MEDWRDVKGYEGIYKVSNTGKVRSLGIYQKPRLLKLLEHSKGNGYQVGLTKNGITKKKFVHTLVAEAYIPNPEERKIIKHKDHNKFNNNVNNLEWAISHRKNLKKTKYRLIAETLGYREEYVKSRPELIKVYEYFKQNVTTREKKEWLYYSKELSHLRDDTKDRIWERAIKTNWTFKNGLRLN